MFLKFSGNVASGTENKLLDFTDVQDHHQNPGTLKGIYVIVFMSNN